MPPSRSNSERIRLPAALALLAALALVAVRSLAPSANRVGGDTAPLEAKARSDAARSTVRSSRHGASAAGTPLLHHAPTPSVRPLPPRNALLADIYNELKARADAGDAAAASRLYRDVQRCWGMQQAERAIARVLPMLPEQHGDVAIAQPTARGMEVRMLDDLRALVARDGALCAGATKAQIESLVPAMFRAAQLGDVRAIGCYGASGFDSMPGLLDHPEWLADMRDYIPSMYDYALRRGDWVAVELLHQAYAGVFVQTPAGQAIHPDPAMAYRYLRLERLGATDAFAAKLDRMLGVATNGPTPQQIADGDAWANDAYARYFHGSSSNDVSNGANICGDPEN